MEVLGAGYSLYSYGRAAVGLVNPAEGAASTKIQYQYYDPLLTLFELAMIPTEQTSKQHNIKLYYFDVITRCPDSWSDRAKRTISWLSWLSGPHQRRKQAKELVEVVVRAVRWYDPNEDSEFSRSIRFLFEKAVEGLTIYRETYSEDDDENTNIALKHIDKARNFLEIKLGSRGDEEAYRAKGEKYGAMLEAKTAKQKKRDKVLKENGIRCDTRSLWVVHGDGERKNVELVTSKVKELMNIYELKSRMKEERRHDVKMAFNNAKLELEASLKARQKEFVAMMT